MTMTRWMTEAERAEREQLLEDARGKWMGAILDYGEFSREVFDVEWDEARGRVILCARAPDEDGYVPEPEGHWELD